MSSTMRQWVVLSASCILLLSDVTAHQATNSSDESNKIMDVSDFSVYYDIETNQTIKKMLPRPWYRQGWVLRLPFAGGPCACDAAARRCDCCAGVRIDALSFDRRTCAVITYEPLESTIDIEIKMNNKSVLNNTFSARNPPPFCVPIPVPYLPPGFMDMCVRLFDVVVMDQKLHVCMDMDTRVDKAPILVLHFDCMVMGLDGVTLSKPANNGTVTDEESASTSEPVADDIYDPVTENKVSK